MPAKRLSMRKIKDVLRLCWGQGVSKRQVARSCGISRPTVRAYLRRAEAAGLCWPLPAELDDGALERLLFLSPSLRRGRCFTGRRSAAFSCILLNRANRHRMRLTKASMAGYGMNA